MKSLSTERNTRHLLLLPRPPVNVPLCQPVYVCLGKTKLVFAWLSLRQDTWKDLPALLAWFVEGLVADPEAELSFSPKLNKQQRALVHT